MAAKDDAAIVSSSVDQKNVMLILNFIYYFKLIFD